MHPMAMDTKATHFKLLKDKHVDEPSIFSLGLTMLILFVLISLGQIALAGLTAMIVLNLAGKFTMDIEVSLAMKTWQRCCQGK